MREPYGNEVRSSCRHPCVLLMPSAYSCCPLFCTHVTPIFVPGGAVWRHNPTRWSWNEEVYSHASARTPHACSDHLLCDR